MTAAAAAAGIIAIDRRRSCVLGGRRPVCCMRRRRTRRRARVSAALRQRPRSLGSLGDPALRRRLQLLPVPGRRGRPGREPLPRPQPEPSSQRAELDQAVRPRRLDRRAVRALPGADGAAQPRPLVHRPTSRSRRRSATRRGPTIALVGISTLLSTVFGVLLGIAAALAKTARRPTTRVDDVHDGDVLDAGLLARHAAAHRCSPSALGWFPVGGIEDPTSDATGLAKLADQAQAHVPARASR